MLDVRLLGQFDLRLEGTPVELPSRPAQSLLAYLLLTAGTRHRREKLAGLLWADASDSNARSNLRHTLWRIRKAIEPSRKQDHDYLLADDISLAFNPAANYWLDAAMLEQPVDGDWHADALLRAVSVYQGDLLPGFYDDWVVLERERLRAVFEQKIHLLLERLIAEARWQEVQQWAERWIALGDVPEPAYRALMYAHSGLGDLARVADVFQRCVDALDRDLGVPPSEKTRATYAWLRTGVPLPGGDVVKYEAPVPGVAPFKGLHYFDEDDAGIFCGRERLTASLVARLRDHRFLAIVGASGSGKSSLLRAGLVPALKRGVPVASGTRLPEGSDGWQIRVFTPTAEPLAALAAALTADAEAEDMVAVLQDDLARAPSTFERAVHAAGASTHASVGAEQHDQAVQQLLVVDQFEELLTLCRDEVERKTFIDHLLAACRDNKGATAIVIALRADFYAHCAQYPDLRAVLARHQEYIGPMSNEDLRRAIEEPARRAGWEFEPGLVEVLLRDVGAEPGALPLLSHALLETWRRRRGRTLTLAGYTEAGGVRAAIATTAETIYQQLDAEHQRLARRIFLRLTELGEGTQDTRRRAAPAECARRDEDVRVVEHVLQTLADARLITTAEGAIDVAHEALIREWPRLREWLLEDRESLRLHRHLTSAAQAWDRLQRDPGELYRGARLTQVREWAALHADELNPLERTFLQTAEDLSGQEEVEREAQRQRELAAAQQVAETERQRAEEQARAARMLRRRAVALLSALFIAGVLAVVAVAFGRQAAQNAQHARAQQATAEAERSRAETEGRIARSRELAAAAISALQVDPERSILLALQALAVTRTPQAEDALHQAVQVSRVKRTLSAHEDGAYSVAFSPDGTRLATAGDDGMAKVWELATGNPVLTLAAHNGEVWSIAWSGDGKRLATAGADGMAKVWDTATGKATLILAGHTAAVQAVVFSQDGTRLATASDDTTSRVWDTLSGKPIRTLSGHTGPLYSVVFSPDGLRLATAGEDRVIRVWDARSGQALLSIEGPSEYDIFNSLAFSSDGQRIAGASDETNAYIWDASSGQHLLTLYGHSNLVLSIAFSPDDTRLVTGGQDWTTRVWDARSGQQLLLLPGHVGAIAEVTFSRDGTSVATASWDGTARQWDVSPERSPELLTLFAQTDQIWHGSFSPDGKRIATGGRNGVAKIWDAQSGKELVSLPGHTMMIRSLAFSPDGARLATASADRTVRLWDVASGTHVVMVSGRPLGFMTVVFSPDGHWLAAASRGPAEGGQATIWDAATGRVVLKVAAGSDIINAAVFTPDGGRLITAIEDPSTHVSRADVYDVHSGARVLSYGSHPDTVWDVAVSPDGARVATASRDGTAKIWDAASGKELHTLQGHTSTLTGVVFSPDGTWLASVSRDDTIRLWDVATGEALLTLAGNNGGLSALAFSPDGKRLAAGGNGGAFHVYALQLEELISLAHTRVTRSLTTEECQKYLHVEQCPVAR